MWQRRSRSIDNFVDTEGRAVVAEVLKNGEYFSTDYMLLYRFSDVWEIVSKVFTK